MMTKSPQPCGTHAAFQRHLYRGEKPCAPCIAARDAYYKAARKRRKSPDYNKRDLQPCGTSAAYQRHLSRGEVPCAECREAMKAYARTISRKDHARNRELLRHYGITLDDKAQILAHQGGVCAIGIMCKGAPLAEQDAKVDHDHGCGTPRDSVRGILCRDCNTLLGKLGDNLLAARRAFALIENYLTNQTAETQKVLQQEPTMKTQSEDTTTQHRWESRHGLLG